MTMHIVYLKNHDGNERGTAKFTETSLARRLCDNGVAVPFVVWYEKQAKEAEQKAVAKAAKKEKAKAKKPVQQKPKRRSIFPEKAVRVEK